MNKQITFENLKLELAFTRVQYSGGENGTFFMQELVA